MNHQIQGVTRMQSKSSIKGVIDVLPSGKTVIGHADGCTWECTFECLHSCNDSCTTACGSSSELLNACRNDAYYGHSTSVHRIIVYPKAPPSTSLL